MSKIFWREDSIVVIPRFFGAESHKHLMLQMFMKAEGIIEITVGNRRVKGNCILLDSSVEHSVSNEENADLFVLIDPTSVVGKYLQEYYVRGEKYCVLNIELWRNELVKFYNNQTDETCMIFISCLFNLLGIEYSVRKIYDERIAEVFDMVGSSECIENSVESIADRLALSPSRLSHLFKEQTGIALKSYIVLCKLKKAYLSLMQGKSITESAMEAGFDSSSHLAATNKKLTGMTISNVIKDSGFLKV